MQSYRAWCSCYYLKWVFIYRHCCGKSGSLIFWTAVMWCRRSVLQLDFLRCRSLYDVAGLYVVENRRLISCIVGLCVVVSFRFCDSCFVTVSSLVRSVTTTRWQLVAGRENPKWKRTVVLLQNKNTASYDVVPACQVWHSFSFSLWLKPSITS